MATNEFSQADKEYVNEPDFSTDDEDSDLEERLMRRERKLADKLEKEDIVRNAIRAIKNIENRCDIDKRENKDLRYFLGKKIVNLL